MSRGATLIGRTDELTLVSNALGSRGIVIAGAAGVGKSRLAAEAVSLVEGDDRRVSTCSATHSVATIPFGSLTHLLPPRRRRDHLDVAALFATTFEHIADALADGLLVVDDAHLLDDTSAGLVNHLVRHSDVSVLVTMRSGEAAPSAIDALWKEELLPRLELFPLTKAAVGHVASDLVGGTVSVAAVDRLFSASAGNPLYLRELIVAASDTGDLRPVDGVWIWSGDVTPSARLTAVVGWATERVSSDARSVLEMLALIEPLPVELLATLTDASGLRDVELAGLVTVDAHGARLSHPLYAEVLLAKMGSRERRRAVRVLVDALSAQARADAAFAARLAAISLDVGESPPADLATIGSVYASLNGDPALGTRLAGASLARDPGSFAARLALGQALSQQGQFGRAEHELTSLLGREPDDAGITEVAQSRVGAVFWDESRTQQDAVDIVDAAMRRVVEPGHIALLRAVRAELAMNRGRLADAIAMCDDVLCSEGARPDALLLAAHIGSLSASLFGHAAAGTRLADSHWQLAVAEQASVPLARGWLLLDRWVALIYCGDVVGALAMCDELIESPRLGPPGFDGSVALFHGRTHLLAGHPVTAEGWLRQAISSLRSHDPRGYLAWALGLLGAACALRGDIDAGERFSAESDHSIASARRLFDADRRLAGAWVLAAHGRFDAARSLAETIGAEAVDRGVVGFATIAWYDAMRLGSAAAPSVLVDLTARSDTPLAAVIAAHVDAVGTRSGEDLRLVADRLAALGLDVAAAEAAGSAAEAFARDGRHDSARRCVALASTMLGRCEGIRTPATVTQRVGDVRLTHRESEVAAQAAHGSSNRDIAKATGTSVRTVEGHLLRAFVKLGVRHRSELADLLLTDRHTNPDSTR